MLLHEITPFAERNRELVQESKDLLAKINVGATVSEEEIVEAIRNLSTVQRALDRFEVCAKDEWQMKERALEKARHCRLHHRELDN